MISCKGIDEVLLSKERLDKLAQRAPTPIIMAFPIPPAVPENCLFTDKIPTLAFGIINPFPRPINIQKLKKLH